MSNEQSGVGRKLAKWMLYHDAWIELAEVFEGKGMDIHLAHFGASKAIEEQLKKNSLRSMTREIDEFYLRFCAPTLGQEWSLAPDGGIPREFWTHYFNTRRKSHNDYDRGIHHPLGEGDEANCGQSTFWFVSRQGWKEDGHMEGHASDVLLYRPDIALLSRRVGERDAVYDEQDLPAVERVIAALDRSAALKLEAASLGGANPQARLRKKLRDRGIKMR